MSRNTSKSDEWVCPINYPGCKSNCGNYGCGNHKPNTYPDFNFYEDTNYAKQLVKRMAIERSRAGNED